MRVSLLIAALLATASPFDTAQAAEAPVVTHRQLTAPGAHPVEMHLVRFDRDRATLRVLALAAGQTVAQAARSHGAMAGVNGGYFKPDQTPLGLVMSQGVVLHPLERAKILSGVLSVTGRGANLLRVEEFAPSRRVREALQAGPFLVDHGATVAGLNATRRAERTVLLADRQGVAALLTTTTPVTLAEMGQLLATPGMFGDLKIDRALNLDGGSSTALWVAADGFSRPEWKPVRNAVAVTPRL